MGAFPSSSYIPTVQAGYVLEGLFSNAKFAQLMASGIFSMDTVENLVSDGGDFINVPSLVQMDDFARTDITSTSAVVGTRIASYAGKLPVLRDYSHKSLTEHDMIRTGENFFPMLARDAGNKVAKRVIKQLDGNLKACLTVAGVNHVKDTTAACTVANLIAAKSKLGDQADTLSTMLVHSKVWVDLLRDFVATYSANAVVSGDVIKNGSLATVLGIGKIVISDDLTADAGATSSSGDDIYWTYFLAPGAIQFGYQAEPRVKIFEDSRVPSTLITFAYKMDYCVGVKGYSFGGSANPTDADYALYTNYSVATEDVRNIGAVALKSYGAVYA